MSEPFLLLRRPAPDDAQTRSKRERGSSSSSGSGEKRKSSKSSKKSGSSSSSAPKSILKNSDPNASYHKQRASANIEELLQSELPLPASSSRRRHRVDRDGDNDGVAERNVRNAAPHESDASNRWSAGGQRASESRRADRNRKGVTESGVALYDQPKVPSVGQDRPAATGSERRRRAAPRDEQPALYENFDFGISGRRSTALYDVPRASKHKGNRDQENEAIYQNERLEPGGNGNADVSGNKKIVLREYRWPV
jgi:hypothetical protein